MSIHTVDVRVRSELPEGKGYRLKVSVVEIGLYIDGFTARPSDKNTNGWWIQPPANNIRGKWIPVCEFDKNASLWRSIEKEAVRAIDAWTDELIPVTEVTTADVLPTDKEMDKVIEQGFQFPEGFDYGTKPEPPRRYHD